MLHTCNFTVHNLEIVNRALKFLAATAFVCMYMYFFYVIM